MSYWGACERVVLGLILALSFSATSRAQEQQPPVESAQLQTPPAATATPSSLVSPAPSVADDPNWHFTSLSYLWFPGMSGTVGAKGYDKSVSVILPTC